MAVLAALSILMSLVPSAIVSAAETENVDIRVDQDDLLDIVLTLGKTDTNVASVEADLIAALVEKGVPLDKINIQAVESSAVSAGNTSSGWEVYDHTNNSGSAIQYYRPYYGEVNGNYNLNNHIAVTTGVQTNIDFYGYGAPAYKDFMYMPNDDYGKKTFNFTIQEDVFYDALNGAGFLFNTKMTPTTDMANRMMSGYLLFFQYPYGGAPTAYVYKFTNVNVNTFHNDQYTDIQSYAGFTPIASFAVGTEKTRTIKIEASADSLKMWYNSTTPAQWTLSGTSTKTDTVPLATDFGSYGFGPLVGYLSHGCAQPTHFAFNNVTMSTESTRRFSEVIREPEWRENSKRFIINAEDGAVADFSDPVALGEILTRLGNEDINYIGWGKNAADGLGFISKNDGNGTYVDKTAGVTDTYAEQIDALATYIYNNYIDGVQNDTDWLLYGNPNTMTITPESEQTNTIDQDWPNGKWRIEHNENYFENSTGVALYDGQYLNNLDISFVETGKYDIYYKDVLLKSVYVHRSPIAGFDVSVNASYAVTITDTAYDPDRESDVDKGIQSTSWAYRETNATTWIEGQPTTLQADKNYVIRQIVVDQQGVQGNPFYRYVSTSSVSTAKPVAEFTMTPGRLLTYQSETVQYSDTSYDPQGSLITEQTWTITRDGTSVYTGSTPKTSFSGSPAGTYKIALKVKNANNVWSEEVARYLVVVRDTTAPSVSCDTAANTFNTAKTVKVSVLDEAGGSGFSSRYSVVDTSAATPATWGSMGTNAAFSVALSTPGTWYVHVKALDYAGNQTISTFGPFAIVDNQAPSAPSITVVPEYTDGTWVTSSLAVIASGSTDDFTAIDNLRYYYSVNGGANYYPGNNVIFTNEGVQTVYFRVRDESGNFSSAASKVVKIDFSAPAVPDYSAVSNSLSYVAGTWATSPVEFTLSGSSDAISAVAGYEYRIDGGLWQNGSTAVLSSSGKYSIEYRSVDLAGNYSDIGSSSIWLDTDAPSAPAVSTTTTYTEGTWTTTSLTLEAAGSLDNMTPAGNLVYEYSLDGVTFSAGKSVTISNDGTYTVYFRVTDEAGLSCSVVSRTVKIDGTAPTLPIYAATENGGNYASGVWATSPVTFTLSGSVDMDSTVAGYQYRINGGEWQSGDTAVLSNPGKSVIEYYSFDVAGNSSTTGTSDIWIDMQAPTAPQVGFSPDYTEGAWSALPITVSASGSTDDLTSSDRLKYMYSLDGAPYEAGSVVPVDTNGSHTISFKVVDDAGLESLVVTRTVNVDTTAPSQPVYAAVAGSSAYTAATWAREAVTFTLSGATDEGGSQVAGYEYRIDGGAWQSGNTAVLSVTGKYSIEYRSVDAAGNYSAVGTGEIWVDTVAPADPTINTSVKYTDGTWTNTPITLTAIGSTDDYTDEANLVYSYSINGADYVTGSSVAISNDGIYSVCFKVTDEAGNDTQAVPFTVKLDASAPSVPVYKAQADGLNYVESTWSTHPVLFTLSGAVDQGGSTIAGYEYKIDDGAWQSGDTGSLNGSGKYKITYRSLDAAGNYSPSVSSEIWIDLEAPTNPVITIKKVNGDVLSKILNFATFRVFFNDEIEVTITTDDATSGIAHLFWKTGENEVLQSTDAGTVTFRIPLDYKEKISAFSEDVSGLISGTSVSDGVILEDDLPVMSIVLDPDSSMDLFKFDLVVSDTGSGIKTITYTLGNSGEKIVDLVEGQTAPVTLNTINLSISGIGMTRESFLLNVDVLDLAGNHMTSSVDLMPLFLKDQLKKLPNPETATQKDKEEHASDILGAIRLINLLTDDERKGVSQEDVRKLDDLINYLNPNLVIISKDAASGAAADRIGTSVKIAELNNSKINLITLALKATPYTAESMPGYVSAVQNTLKTGNKDVLIAYDIYLLKTFTDADGKTTSEHVLNKDINSTLTVRIPLPSEYEKKTALSVIHIAENGDITSMNAAIVTVDGQKYLQFETGHFSSYAVIADAQKAITKTGEQGGIRTHEIIAITLVALSAGAFALISMRRRNAKGTRKSEN